MSEEIDHHISYMDDMREDEGRFNWSIAPFTGNSTYLDIESAEYHSEIRRLPPERQWEIKKRDARLQKFNAGTHNGEWRDKTWLHRSDDWYRCHAIADQLEMSEAEKWQVCALYTNNIDMRGFPSQKYGKQTKWLVVPFCICIHIHNGNQPLKKDGEVDQRYAYYPGKKSFPPRYTYAGHIRNDYLAGNDRHAIFAAFEESLELDVSIVISCLEKVRKIVPDFNSKPDFDFIRTEDVNRIFHYDDEYINV